MRTDCSPAIQVSTQTNMQQLIYYNMTTYGSGRRTSREVRATCTFVWRRNKIENYTFCKRSKLFASGSRDGPLQVHVHGCRTPLRPCVRGRRRATVNDFSEITVLLWGRNHADNRDTVRDRKHV